MLTPLEICIVKKSEMRKMIDNCKRSKISYPVVVDGVKNPASLKTNNFKVAPYAAKVAATMFWDSSLFLLVDFLQWANIMRAWFLIFLNGNALPHAVKITNMLLK